MMGIQIRKENWQFCFLDVTAIDFENGYVFGIIMDLKSNEIRDDNYSAPIKGWVPVLSVEDVIAST